MMKIAVLCSGGVDSSVAVHNLVETGHKPVLFYIKIGMENEDNNRQCTGEDDIYMVSFLAKKYGLEMGIIDLQTEYWDYVVKYMIDSVKQGLTPNPDIMCNKLIKFGCFEEKQGKYFDYLATGHYATTTKIKDTVFLSTAKDKVKDQTYFLGQIEYNQLKKLLFPIGHLLKQEVRAIAEAAKLPAAYRKDSQGICFLGKINYNDFIKRYTGMKKGKIIDFRTGKILGEHNGYWFYTVGQRKGLGLSGGPWYVVKKNAEENIIYVSNFHDTQFQYGTIFNLEKFRFISGNIWNDFTKKQITFKIRHTPDFTKGILEKMKNTHKIISEEKIQGIASGQFGVVYDNDMGICMGSGVIV